MILDSDTQKEYMLLRNYKEGILIMRGIQIKIPINALEQIESDTSPLGEFNETDKIKLRSIIQIDIISKIMMYLEDLIILAESFRTGKFYYQFLDSFSDDNQKELGDRIKEFFKNIDSFSDGDWLRIMSYANPDDLDLSEKDKELVLENLKKNTVELRRLFKEMDNFGKTNHPIFRRYKHAGSPIVLGATKTNSTHDFLSEFDSFCMVSKGKDPTKDVIPIPYSAKVIKGYEIIIQTIQRILTDMITNRIACIERRLNGLIPNESYSENPFSDEEKKDMKKIIDDFYEKHPPNTQELQHLDLKSNITEEDILWYLNLENFLEECAKRKQRLSDQQKP